MNILILAAGPVAAGHDGDYPLCLKEFGDVPLIEGLLARCRATSPGKVIVALNEEEVQSHHLDSVVRLLWPRAEVLGVRARTGGAACTALLAAAQIDNDDELLIINGNELLDADYPAILADFRSRRLDAGTAVFRSVHPRYSYVRVDSTGLVVEASEKKPISTHATAGFYWFAQGRDFVAAAKNLIRKDASANGGYYICPTFNELILKHRRIGIFAVESSAYHPLKTERQIERYESLAERERTI